LRGPIDERVENRLVVCGQSDPQNQGKSSTRVSHTHMAGTQSHGRYSATW
jgi:hypothetical protein